MFIGGITFEPSPGETWRVGGGIKAALDLILKLRQQCRQRLGNRVERGPRADETDAHPAVWRRPSSASEDEGLSRSQG